MTSSQKKTKVTTLSFSQATLEIMMNSITRSLNIKAILKKKIRSKTSLFSIFVFFCQNCNCVLASGDTVHNLITWRSEICLTSLIALFWNFPLLFSHSKNIRMSTLIKITITYYLLIKNNYYYNYKKSQ